MLPKESEAVAGFWEDIGIKVDIRILDFPSYWPKVGKSENAGEVYDFRFVYPDLTLENSNTVTWSLPA